MDQQNYRSRINNPCDHLFWQNRGYQTRPYNWKQILEANGYYDQDNYNYTASGICNSFHHSLSNLAQSLNNLNVLGQSSYSRLDREAEIQKSRLLNPHDPMFWQKYGYSERPQNYKEILKICNYWVARNKGLEVNIPSPQQLESLKLQKEQEKEQRRRQREENPEDELFWKTRGYASRPTNWEEIYKEHCELEKNFLNSSNRLNKNQKRPGILKNSASATISSSLVQPSTSGIKIENTAISNSKKLNQVAGGSQTVTKKSVAEDIQDLCKLCWEKPLNSVILECAHIATCITCGQKLNECPICRQKVTRVIRTFKA